MRTVILTAAVLSASLALAGPLHAQPKETDISKAQAGTLSRNDPFNGKTLPEWIRQIKDPDPSLAETAIRTVAVYRSVASAEATPSLVDALSFRDTSLRVNACITLTMIGVDENYMARAVSELKRRLQQDNQAIVRFYAAITLGQLKRGQARLAVPELAQACSDPASWEIRRAAAYALGQAGAATSPTNPVEMNAVRALMRAASRSNEYCSEVRLAAVISLGSVGIPPYPAEVHQMVQALTYALNDRYHPVVIWAHMGLIALGEPADRHVKAIAKYMTTRYDKTNKDGFEAHVQAIRALGVLKKDAKSEVPALIKELDDTKEEPLVVATACWALGEIGRDAEPAVPALAKLTDQKGGNETVKATAKEAIDKIKGTKKGG
jgi:HEAT repeat protein